MQTLFNSLVRNAKRVAGTALVAGSLLLSGCASGINGTTQTSAAPHVRVDVIYVYSFGATADQVKMDSGIAQQLKTAVSGESAAQKQVQTAIDAREQVADEIVRELQSMGLRAVRVDGPAPANQNALVVEGTFQTIDEGKRRRRILIGLGAGKSEVSASVQILYKPAEGAPIALQSFSANADSGHMPGIAETAGVGAAAGHVATAAVTGTALHGVSEVKHDSVSADAKKLGDSIAKQIAAASVANGWMSAERVD
jgi:PBP1b-binding outer membrane lipoprotein LpoB